MRRRPLRALLLKNLFFLAVVPGSVLAWVPLAITGFEDGPWAAALGPARWFGVPLVVSGVALLLWSVFGFMAMGRGTPAPTDPPRRLVVWGPYLWVRNPMYVGVLTALVGEALWLGQPALLGWAAMVAVGVHLFVVMYEEPTLRESFGADYESFLETVPRWWPRRPAATSRSDGG